MVERQQSILSVQPQMVAALRLEFQRAVDQVTRALAELNRRGYLPAPWLGDESSQATAAHYVSRALDAPDSSYHALLAYRDELTRVHDTLQRMEDTYRRTEGDAAARWGRMI